MAADIRKSWACGGVLEAHERRRTRKQAAEQPRACRPESKLGKVQRTKSNILTQSLHWNAPDVALGCAGDSCEQKLNGRLSVLWSDAAAK